MPETCSHGGESLHSSHINGKHPGETCSHTFVASDLSKQKVQRLLWVAGLVFGFAILEIGVGIWSHSVALFADAEHLIVDCGAVLVALAVAWWGQRQPDGAGAKRLEAWAALGNGLALIAIALWIAWEAIASLQAPPAEILSLPMLITAVIGLGINGLNAKLLHQHSHDDLNVKGVLLHAIADAASALGILIAALAIYQFHWQRADGLVGLAIAGLIWVGATPLVLASIRELKSTQLQDARVPENEV
jgi:cobalt-zinc-cadmium efflux system protein